MSRTAHLLLLIALCAACAPRPQTAAVNSAPTTTAPVPPGTQTVWDVTQVSCGQLLNADDDDRAAAMMFYYGYLAASAGIQVIDVSKIDGNVHRVVEQCTRAPTLTVPQAFDVAFGRPPRP